MHQEIHKSYAEVCVSHKMFAHWHHWPPTQTLVGGAQKEKNILLENLTLTIMA